MKTLYKFKNNINDQSQFLTQFYLAVSYGKLSINICLLWAVAAFRKLIYGLRHLQSIIGLILIALFIDYLG